MDWLLYANPPQYITLYHGTDPRTADEALKNGFERSYSQFQKLHLTDSLGVARAYASYRGWDVGAKRGAVLQVQVPSRQLRPDAWACVLLHGRGKVDKPLKLNTWKASLQHLGSVTTTSGVPAARIKFVEYVPSRAEPKIVDRRPLVVEVMAPASVSKLKNTRKWMKWCEMETGR